MKLSKETKKKIKEEYQEWSQQQYCGQDLKTRQKRGAFYTPTELSIKMLEKFANLRGSVCDPCLGAGGLLAAAIIAGADPNLCFGIEPDIETLKLARKRLRKLGVPSANLIQGDALDDETWQKLEKRQTTVICKTKYN